ncbi:MAG TPA: metalloregulator ArsR/SmtB family transcription factor [Polyangiaceae bacterium]|jgi:ArsR family transcriptional regulator|nr:metalloregulator ArsR/SmtB family transcription factor [Polyangiaceae bacterium]
MKRRQRSNSRSAGKNIEGSEDELAMLARALGHPARVHIVRMLARKPCGCAELVRELWLAQSTVSQHLKMLREVRLIRGDDDGTGVGYRLEPRTMRRLKALVARL